ncbi:MAG: cupin domain-containing protein [Paracoccaceae bacterium]
MPKIDLAAAPKTRGSDYPPPHGAPFADRLRQRLGDAVGLTQFGVSLTALPPGGVSSLRHWHEVEDEAVFVLSGELILVEETGETVLGPGEAAGFKAGVANAHHFINRGSAPATYLEIGSRPAADRCHYADVDLVAHDADGRSWYTRRDGTALTEPEDRFP